MLYSTKMAAKLLVFLNVVLLVKCSPAADHGQQLGVAGDDSDCVTQFDWCYSDADCCDGLGCDFPPGSGGSDGLDCVQAGVCRSVRESVCALWGEHCDVLPCCDSRPCECYGDWVMECSCA